MGFNPLHIPGITDQGKPKKYRRPPGRVAPVVTSIGQTRTMVLPVHVKSILNGSRGSIGTATVEKHKQKGMVALFIEQIKPYPAKPYDVTLTRYGPRTLDDDNLRAGFKYVRDAVAEALGVNDGNTAVIRFIYEDEKCSDYGCRITIKTRNDIDTP